MNIFQRRAQRREAEKFSNSTQPVVSPEQNVVVEEETFEPTQNIFERHAAKNKQKQSDKFDFLNTLRDVGEQVVTKGISGIGGAYGNILDTFNLQSKEQIPSEKQKNAKDFATLEKIESGQVPSVGELMELSDDDVLPRFSRLPTSKDIQSQIQNITGIGEGKTPAGRIAGRGSEFLGEGLAFPGGGAKSLLALGGAGLAGQGVREAGLPEALATGVEIGGSILPSAVSGKITPLSKTAKDTVSAGRQVGLTERQIAPLIQSEGKSAVLSKVARKGTKTKKLFGSIKDSLGDSYQNIKNSVSNFGNVNNANRAILETKFKDIRNDLAKTLNPSKDKKDAIKFIDAAIKKVSQQGASPEELINFWQDINKSVNWNSIQGGKKSLTILKEPILEVLNNVAPIAAKDFELTNQLYTKYAQISKKLKPGLVDSLVNKGEIISAIPSGLALVYGNPAPLMSLGGEVAMRLLTREMLINPYFQTIAGKLVTNFNAGSVKGVTEIVNQVKDYMTRKHPEQDWGFLTEPQED